MPYCVFFAFSTGLAKTLRVPKGTVQRIKDRIAETESKLKLEREKYQDNPWRWNSFGRYKDVDDDTLCQVVSQHNSFIVWLWGRLIEWSKTPVSDGEEFTLEEAAALWPFLENLHVPTARWNRHYYREQMERAYEVMRGRKTDGVSFGAKTPLTPEQADAVITLFAEFLDDGDIRLAVPRGHDHLKASYDGGYDWCEKHGAIDEDDFGEHLHECMTFRREHPEEAKHRGLRVRKERKAVRR